MPGVEPNTAREDLRPAAARPRRGSRASPPRRAVLDRQARHQDDGHAADRKGGRRRYVVERGRIPCGAAARDPESYAAMRCQLADGREAYGDEEHEHASESASDPANGPAAEQGQDSERAHEAEPPHDTDRARDEERYPALDRARRRARRVPRVHWPHAASGVK